MICLSAGFVSAGPRGVKKLFSRARSDGQVAVDVEAQSLEHAQFIEERAADDEDVFFFHPSRLAGPENIETKKSNGDALSSDNMSALLCKTNPLPTPGATGSAKTAPAFFCMPGSRPAPESDAEDILQEAIVESWQRAGGMPSDALVFSTIRRRAIDLARSSDRRAAREQAEGEPDQEWFTPDVEDRETQRILTEAVKSLPPNYREVVTLKGLGRPDFPGNRRDDRRAAEHRCIALSLRAR